MTAPDIWNRQCNHQIRLRFLAICRRYQLVLGFDFDGRSTLETVELFAAWVREQNGARQN